MGNKVFRGALESNSEGLYDAIKKAAGEEGILRYYDGGLGGPKLSSGRAVFDFFRKKTGVEIEWYTAGPEPMITRIWGEAYSGELKFDVLHGYDLAWLWYPLKERKSLMSYVPPEAAALRKGTSDPDGYFHHFSGALCVAIYNPNTFTPSELPKSYKDLLQPRWKDHLLAPDWIYHRNPLMVPLLTWLYALYGPEYITALARQNVKFLPEPRSAVDILNKGEPYIIMGTGAPRYIEGKRKGESLAYLLMEEGVFHRQTYLGINAQTKKPKLSKLFVRFLLTPEVQKIRVESDFEPSRTDVAAPDGYPDTSKYEQEGKLFSDSSTYWVDIQKRYRHLARETYIDALEFGYVRGESIHPFRNLVDRVPGIRGDGYNTEYGTPG